MKQTLLLFFATIITFTSYACRCVIMQLSEEIATADNIFIGTVAKKTMAEKAYYLFNVSKTFKGDVEDTVTIKTGFGGPDCGMVFETGKTYLVYSYKKQTSWCRRNALAEGNPDINHLRYLLDTAYANKIGKMIGPLLTDSEAEYLNAEFSQSKRIDFHGKKIAFVYNRSFIGKQQYFNNWGGKRVANILIILTEEEKQKANGYDAIIISWRKLGVSKGFRKKLIKRLS